MHKFINSTSQRQFIRKPLMLACAILVAPVAQSQMLEEVIVTAQKREQNLQDVPIAVSAITGEMLAESGVKDILDLQSTVPSLRVSTEQTSTATTFSIRGVFTSGQNFGLESSVGLYVDGVYRARQGSMINNLVDVASVEVLRGPQGTLFGRNTPSGAVSITSVRPDHEGSGFIEGTYGDYDLLSASGAKSFSVVEDVLALRATGFITTRDGTADSVDFGDDKLNDRDRWGLRLQGLYTPTDDLSIQIIADYSEIDEICCAAGVWKNNLVADDVPGKTGTDVYLQDLGGTVPLAEDWEDYNISNSFLPESANEDGGISMQIDWHTDAFLLTSITSYRAYDSYDFIDIDFADVDGGSRKNEIDQSAFSQELRISNEYDRFNYVAGLFYFNQTLDSDQETLVGDDTQYLVQDLNPVLAIFPDAFPGGTGALNVAEQEHQSYAIFGQFDYSLTESFLLTAGLRWTKEDKDVTNTFTQDASSCDPNICFQLDPGYGFWGLPDFAPRDDVDESIDDDRITGTAKISWFMNDATMFYASYGTGYKSGGVNTDRILESIDVVFDAETSESYELGMKADFPDQALRVNVAIHATDTEDLQTVSFQGTGFALQNAGVAETYGIEIDAFWQPTDSLSLMAAYAYNHAEYAEFEEGNCWIGTPWHTGLDDPGLNEDGSSCDRSGGSLAGNPENAFALTANQAFSLGGDLSGYVYAEYTYTDARMTDLNNDPEKEDDSYDLVNLRAALVFENWDAELVLWGRNVFDEKYTGTIADKVLQDGSYIAYASEGATWGITAKKHF
ncbi:MAG: TonB-dependent receptor [Halioglobus sp.]